MMKSTTTDPVVAQVRDARDKHATRFGYDIRAIFKDIQYQQSSTGRKYVRYPARRATTVDKSGITKL
jgi:hypothetical protein